MAEDPPILSEFFAALQDTIKQAGDEAAVVTIIMPSGELCDFLVTPMGPHDPDQVVEDESGVLWFDDSQVH